MTDNEQLIQQYLDVVNRALQTNRDHFPWKQIVAMGEKKWHGANIGLGINEDGNPAPQTYTLEFVNGQFVYKGPGKVETTYTWEADKAFMQKVVANPQEYIQHPMKINWDWVKSSLGIGETEDDTPGYTASTGGTF
jgi:hypothetical protein